MKVLARSDIANTQARPGPIAGLPMGYIRCVNDAGHNRADVIVHVWWATKVTRTMPNVCA